MSEKKFDGFSMNDTEGQDVQLENEVSFEDAVDAADRAIMDLKDLELKHDEIFPGSDAYNKVLKVMELLVTGEGKSTEEEILETWKKGYGEWQKRFDEEDKEDALKELKSLLQGALASSERKQALVSKYF